MHVRAKPITPKPAQAPKPAALPKPTADVTYKAAPGNQLIVNASDKDDKITVDKNKDGNYEVTVNKQTNVFTPDQVKGGIHVNARGGDDAIEIKKGVDVPVVANGGGGTNDITNEAKGARIYANGKDAVSNTADGVTIKGGNFVVSQGDDVYVKSSKEGTYVFSSGDRGRFESAGGKTSMFDVNGADNKIKLAGSDNTMIHGDRNTVRGDTTGFVDAEGKGIKVDAGKNAKVGKHVDPTADQANAEAPKADVKAEAKAEKAEEKGEAKAAKKEEVAVEGGSHTEARAVGKNGKAKVDDGTVDPWDGGSHSERRAVGRGNEHTVVREHGDRPVVRDHRDHSVVDRGRFDDVGRLGASDFSRYFPGMESQAQELGKFFGQLTGMGPLGGFETMLLVNMLQWNPNLMLSLMMRA